MLSTALKIFKPVKEKRSYKRICHLIHDDGPGGGPNTVIRHMKYYHKHFNIILLHGGSGRITEYCKNEEINEKELPIDKIWKCIWGWIPLYINLKILSPDLLILHGQWGGALGSLIGKMAKIKKIIHISQWPAFYTDWDLYRVTRNHIVEATSVRLCDKVVCISPGNLYQYQIRFPDYMDKLIHIPNPFDLDYPLTEQDAVKVRKAEGWSNDHINIAAVGRLSTQKHFEWLLESWAIVQSEVPEARLWIVGSGEEETSLHALASQLNINGTCTFLGSRKVGMDYINASDFVVMTSLYEGHANIPMEAHFCGKTIVANSVDGVTNSIIEGENGFLVPAGDIKKFAERIVTLCRTKELRETMGESGRKHVQKFSMDKIMVKYSKLIQEVIGD